MGVVQALESQYGYTGLFEVARGDFSLGGFYENRYVYETLGVLKGDVTFYGTPDASVESSIVVGVRGLPTGEMEVFQSVIVYDDYVEDSWTHMGFVKVDK